jgi:hypothetical protein
MRVSCAGDFDFASWISRCESRVLPVLPPNLKLMPTSRPAWVSRSKISSARSSPYFAL